MKIGFIGIGNMGGPMSANLAEAGHEVTGYDLSPFEVQGVRKAQSVEEAVSARDVVITMLPDGAALISVMSEAIPHANKGTCFIDCSTVDVDSARKSHNMCNEAGMPSLDAPVSGGVVGAENGTLTFMAGGSDEAFAIAEPLFEIMGQKAVHCGGAGAGQSAKICNNMILGISMLGVCEAFVLADRLGLDRQKMFDVVSTSSGYCWSLNAYCPAPGVGPESPADNDYKPGFAAELMLKDLKLSQQAADSTGSATPMGARATELYEDFAGGRGRGKDFSGVLPWLEAMKR